MEGARALGNGYEITCSPALGDQAGDDRPEVGSAADLGRALEVDSTDGDHGDRASGRNGAQRFQPYQWVRMGFGERFEIGPSAM